MRNVSNLCVFRVGTVRSETGEGQAERGGFELVISYRFRRTAFSLE